MEFTGKIIKAFQAREGVSKDGNPWKMQDFMIEEVPSTQWQASHPKRFIFQVSDGRNGRLAQLNITEGHVYKIFFEIECREYNGNFYNTVKAYDARLQLDVPTPIKGKTEQEQQVNVVAEAAQAAQEPAPDIKPQGPIDDLPF